MGNCLRKGSSEIRASEDWDPSISEDVATKNVLNNKASRRCSDPAGESLLGDNKQNVVSSSTKVQIKFTRKELEELLAKIDLEGLSVEQVLDKLINSRNLLNEHKRPWTPALACIPEVE
ncbi:hypothetical protein FRX31_004969 [Thalictrum thalictroides]|uniref:Uncharacterized protein n=1 Tax=Thalictrum thalictroides TaxID=46969 RepID=A0A7J6X6Y1_THATH|nr:hypothetical protein FRX31_004969 [Thalictrum thalictroides]